MLAKSFCNLKDAIHFVFDEGSFFAFQQHTGLQAFKTVPHVLGYVGAVEAVFMAQHARLHDFALVIVGQHSYPSLENDEGFRTIKVSSLSGW